MAILKPFLFFSLLIISVSSLSSEPTSKPLSSAHVELTRFGFPVGLLPTNVRSYSLNTTSGEFYVDLHGACKITLPPDNYLATYNKRVKGKIVQGRIADLDGISVRAFFKSWSITGIKSSGGNLVFEVGLVTVKYPSNNFDESPDCEGKRASS